MLEYIFFDTKIASEFTSFVKKQQVDHNLLEDDDMVTVEVSEEITDAQSDAIDQLYERLLQKNAELMEQGEDALEKNVAGIQVALADGSPCTIRVEPELVSRILSAISMEELRDFAQVIAEGVEKRDNSPLCHVID